MSSAEIQILELLRKANVLEIARGAVDNRSYVFKYGENADVDTGSSEDVWDYGGTYVFSSTANIDKVSSSNVGDTQTVTLCGLADGFIYTEQEVTLTGQTQVTLATPLIRFFRGYNTGTTDFAGDIYVYYGAATAGVPNTAANIRGMIRIGYNQTMMAIYTVPAGKTAYLKKVFAGMKVASPVAQTADITLRVREYGSVFRISGKVQLQSTGNNTFNYEYANYQMIPEKSDIKVTCDVVSDDNTYIQSAFELLLIDN